MNFTKCFSSVVRKILYQKLFGFYQKLDHFSNFGKWYLKSGKYQKKISEQQMRLKFGKFLTKNRFNGQKLDHASIFGKSQLKSGKFDQKIGK